MDIQITDEAFGELKLEGDWIKKKSIEFLGTPKEIEVWVAGNDDSQAIWSEQRDAYNYFLAHEKSIVSEFVEAMYRHYMAIWPDLQIQFGDSAAKMAPELHSIRDLPKVIEVEALVFPIVLARGERRFGFIGECSWDPEHGFGFEMGYSIGGSDKLI